MTIAKKNSNNHSEDVSYSICIFFFFGGGGGGGGGEAEETAFRLKSPLPF